ncbi:cell division protein FtsA [Clostridium fungisolvens]|uniref:Cell division protein FtsA n=1 Tax=Clostridium fungisolvens TaxID=1604897 RepID=A0A6V8SCN6_9CLOT|nr:cell division protein FtsA [Clostridium fungisolvens]GFP74999.1 Cell division protein FtsA [Clostridium fungisolvens]
MIIDNIVEQDVIFSLDIGTRTIKATVGIVKDKKFHVVCERFLEHDERAMIDGQIHDINLVAAGVSQVKRELEEELGFKLKEVAIAAAGRFLRTVESKGEMDLNDEEITKDTLRSLEMTAVLKAEEEINKTTDGKLYCVGYSVKNYYLNGYVISNLLGHKGENVAVEVISTFLPRSVVDSLYSVMNKVNLNVVNLTLEPIAAMEAVVPKNLRLLNIALVDVGAGTSDIAICNKESVTAYGMVPQAGDEVTEAIAQAYLVDFNTAERMKKESTEKEQVAYTDIIGFENTVSSEEIYKLAEPIVQKIAEEVSRKIIDLNGSKAPSAVFLVGGGAHTPYLKELISEKLNIPIQRIGIKGRDAVTDCVCTDLTPGSSGVTVLGIALLSIKSLGHNFIDVTLNDTLISLFNSHKHNVMDVLLHADINPKILMGKNGKNIRFTINGSKRMAFGQLGTNAKIRLNGEDATLEDLVIDGDKITIEYAQEGKDAVPKVIDYLTDLEDITCYFNDKLVTVEPVIEINGEKASIDAIIKNNDEVKITYPRTLKGIKKYILSLDDEINLNVNGELQNEAYEIKNGDRICIVEEKTNTNSATEQYNKPKDLGITIKVFANGESKELKGKKEYVFVDIFNYIEFDLTAVKGRLNLLLNGESAAYTDKLNEGDKIEVFWD